MPEQGILQLPFVKRCKNLLYIQKSSLAIATICAVFTSNAFKVKRCIFPDFDIFPVITIFAPNKFPNQVKHYIGHDYIQLQAYLQNIPMICYMIPPPVPDKFGNLFHFSYAENPLL